MSATDRLTLPVPPRTERRDESALPAAPRAWIRPPLWIAISMSVVLGIAMPLAEGLFPLACSGVLQAIALFFALRVANPADARFRAAMQLNLLLVLAATTWTVFVEGYPGSLLLYYAPPTLLCTAHLLGARAAAAWSVPWAFLVVASEIVPGPNTRDAGGAEVVVLELLVLAAATALAVSLRTAYDMKARELEVLATTDPLTGLANRREFGRALEGAVERARRFDRRGALLFIDLDGLKRVNDEHGHRVGDALIQQVAERLKKNVRAIDVAARLGGDEFVVLMSEFEDEQAALIFAEKLLGILSRRLDGVTTSLIPRASIGIAEFPLLAIDADTLLRRADEAMYAAKQAGGARILRALPDGVSPLD